MTDPVQSRFAPVAAARPGRILGARPVDPSAGGPARGWRLSFDTTDGRGRRTVGGGLLVVPAEPWPGGRSRPLLSLGGLTAGDSSRDPDVRHRAGRFEAAVVDLALARGWAVAVCGLPAGDDGQAGAYALLDIGRAAVHCGAGLAHDAPALVWGHGPGAPAALRAAALHAGYAPELALAGVAASGAVSPSGPPRPGVHRRPHPPVYLYRTVTPGWRHELIAAASAIEWLADRLDPVPVW